MLTIFKYQISNSKPQIISKLQFSNDLNDFVWEVGFLLIGNCLGFGIWCLVFGAYLGEVSLFHTAGFFQ
jgi:hypothetical protein